MEDTLPVLQLDNISPRSKKIRSAAFCYGLSFASIALTILVAAILSKYSIKINLTLLVVAALIIPTWFGGRGPGLLVGIVFEIVTIISNPPTPEISISTYIFGHFSVLFFYVFLVLLVGSRRNVEKQLREQREWLNVTLSSIGDAVIATDTNGIITFINPTAEALTGWTANESVGRPLDEIFKIINEVTREPVENPAAKVLREGAIVGLANPAVLIAMNGKETPIDDSAAPIRTSSGEIIGVVLAFRDVVERKEAKEALQKSEEQLRQSQKLESVGRLAGGIAHDFNNMLTAINGYSDLTLRSLKNDDPLRANIEEIKKAGERSAILTHQLLAFSRRQVLHPVVLNLNEVIVETIKMLKRLIGEDIQLTAVLSSRLGRAKVDPGQLSQIIMNLTVNARDAMPQGGKLTIETANVFLDPAYVKHHMDILPGAYVMLAVSDTGIGMSEETKQHIFEPFFTTKAIGKGTGLGLATVYGIVKQSGGNIELYSEEGYGTTFKIYLPRVIAKPEEIEKHVNSEELPKGTETVLLVEDEDIVRNLAFQILNDCGYHVIEAGSGIEALEKCEKEDCNVDLLLTDVVMPQMSGRELAGRITQIYTSVRILFTSGYTDDAIVRHGVIELGANFIQKPFSPVTLAQKVREILDAK